MKFEPLDQVPALIPVDFFTLNCDVPHVSKPFEKMGTCPDTSELLAEEAFAKISLGWSEEGLFVEAAVNQPFEDCTYPKYDTADSLELFFDTRDVKTAGFATRFCHHFAILPEPVQGVQVQEVTHFRSEDTHPICDPGLITCNVAFERNNYIYQLFFPGEVLHGYDPTTFSRLGFTYKVNRSGGRPQHFSVSSDMVNIAQQPSLWATLKMVRKKGR